VRLAWLSDLHLNFLSRPAIDPFLDGLSRLPADALLIGGDIAEADSFEPLLAEIGDAFSKPVYFVLGNHDFYGGSFASVRGSARSLVSDRLIWLTESETQILDESIALVGDDTWSDGRLGNALHTPVLLNDFVLISDLQNLPRPQLIEALNVLGDEAAGRLRPKLEAASRARPVVVVLLHVPPFRGAAWHMGRISSDDWLPWFSCEAVGRGLRKCAQDHPDTRFWVLCGHTHSSGRYAPCPNMAVLTAAAEYGRPAVQGILDPCGHGFRSTPP
jgi:3',5'-cyclic AMP phosphodiesterase CpdA